MSDELAVPDPILPTPDSPEVVEDEPTPGDEPAAPEESPEAEPKKDDDKEGAPAKGRSEAFEKLLAKYGGDYEKLANSIFEQYNSAARTHEELVELRGMMEELRASKDEAASLDKAVAEDPVVAEVREDMASVNEQATTISADLKGMVDTFQKGVIKIAKLEGALSKADDTERFDIQRELDEAKRQQDRLQDRYDSSMREYKRLEAEWKRLQRSLGQAEAQARSKVDRERKDATRLQQEAKLYRQEFNDALREEATAYGLDPTSRAYTYIDETFRARLSTHMRALSARGVTEPIDIQRSVKVLMKEYAEANGLTRKAGKPSPKPAVATPQREATPAEPRRGGAKKEGELSAADWKARAKQLMP